MKLDTQPLLAVAARLALSGHLDADTYERRRSTLATLEGRLVTKEEHVSAYEEGRARLTLDGSSLAWERWRAENYLLTLARAEVVRVTSVILSEMEMLEREVAIAQQREARSLSEAAQKEARA